MNPPEQGRYFLPWQLITSSYLVSADRELAICNGFADFVGKALPGFVGAVPVYESEEDMARAHPVASYFTYGPGAEDRSYVPQVFCRDAVDYPAGTKGFLLVFDSLEELLAQFSGRPEYFTADLVPVAESRSLNTLPVITLANDGPDLSARLTENARYRARRKDN